MEHEKNQFIQHGYAGSGWLKEQLSSRSKDVEVPPFPALVADILGYVWRGLYHRYEEVFFKKAIWIQDKKAYLELVIFHDLATFDNSELAELVILCHQYHVRLQISPVLVKRAYEGHANEAAGLQLMFHPRKPDGTFWQRHPSLSQACDRISKDIKVGMLQPMD